MTAQITEALFHVGRFHTLYTLPLEPYLVMTKKHELFDGLHANTACTRRYVGVWEIKDGRLFLTRLQTLRDGDFPLDALFPETPKPVFAKWFTGELLCPKGELFKYVHSDFRSLYERELRIFVKSGMVEGERVVINPAPSPRDPQEEFDIPEFLKKR